ncbi:hypothetical protein FRC02_001889 [Tulasnella sp. 418]|nr:hypothetical protein FRC02_001889 [Tulasnella sp. 418]
MTLDLPKTTKALILSTAKKSPDDPLFEISIQERPISTLKENEVLVRIAAAAYNYRELWQRKNQYPGIADGSVMGADGAGVVIASGSTKPDDPIVGKRVFLVPMRGWKSDPRGPEEKI